MSEVEIPAEVLQANVRPSINSAVTKINKALVNSDS
jgi:hypothetical protein